MHRIGQYLDDLRLSHGALFPIVRRVRDIALASGPSVSESFRYGGILFASRANFCGVFAFQAHVTVEFSEGARLADPENQLLGKGRLRRHIRLETGADIDAKHLERWINAARLAADAGAQPED
ncbi:DUF1801 domain-containing protein [Paracoccus sp. IB05]|uniref:DUF1801 domain-containing protein n=1 Tax=Paracoccus sp. IB05 TaxID=2779367 RepID=UPI0018E88669|nr:DUF1801 domain-containing protein [Paracoccus sp. IB05]MBJ2153565.1 DUF1801 domain-containing protein [Paracoccus sp. IB05]